MNMQKNAVLAVGTALFAALSMCLQVRIVKNPYAFSNELFQFLFLFNPGNKLFLVYFLVNRIFDPVPARPGGAIIIQGPLDPDDYAGEAKH